MRKTLVMGWLLAVSILWGFPGLAGAAEEQRSADHEALRAMLRTVTQALNSRDVDALGPLLHTNFSFTTVDQKRFTRLADLKAYFEGHFTSGKTPLKSIVFKPEADDLTAFITPDVGVSHGTSLDTYLFADGDERTMKSRWSATVLKAGGQWKLVALHAGADILNNPVLDAAKGALKKAATFGFAAGLLIGFMLTAVGKRIVSARG